MNDPDLDLRIAALEAENAALRAEIDQAQAALHVHEGAQREAEILRIIAEFRPHDAQVIRAVLDENIAPEAVAPQLTALRAEKPFLFICAPDASGGAEIIPPAPRHITMNDILRGGL